MMEDMLSYCLPALEEPLEKAGIIKPRKLSGAMLRNLRSVVDILVPDTLLRTGRVAVCRRRRIHMGDVILFDDAPNTRVGEVLLWYSTGRDDLVFALIFEWGPPNVISADHWQCQRLQTPQVISSDRVIASAVYTATRVNEMCSVIVPPLCR